MQYLPPLATTQAENEKQILQNVHPADADEDFQYECSKLSIADGGLDQLLNLKHSSGAGSTLRNLVLDYWIQQAVNWQNQVRVSTGSPAKQMTPDEMNKQMALVQAL